MKSKTKIKTSEKCKRAPDYNHIDETINDAYHEAHPLSTLQKPPTKDTKGDGIPTNKRIKATHFSPILFVKIWVPNRKKLPG
jgi:hypothetical protein